MSHRRSPGGLPARLERTRQQFEHWRETREVRSRIPESLWSAAVRMAEAYGINRVAQALRVDYYSLKRRVVNKASPSSGSKKRMPTTFVELTAPATASTECLLELEDISGSKMRIHLQGIETPDLVALARSFWDVES